MDMWEHQELSKYNRYILDKIISKFDHPEFNIYELVKEAVSYKCILPSQNELVMDTYYHVSEYLLRNDFATEKKEMTAYILTSKGMELKKCGSLGKYEEHYEKRGKKSFLYSWINKIMTSENTHGPLVHHYE